MEEFKKPVVACMTGSALGSGFELALGCHWRLATKTTRLGLTEATVGLIPSEDELTPPSFHPSLTLL
jgi:enoyl-CoA hydratase/carnithine racemase